DAPARRGFRMPNAGTDEAVAGLDVDVEGGRIDFAETLVIQARARVGLVGRLVVGEARVAMDAEQRAADRAGIGAVLRADRGEVRLQVRKQLEEGAAHLRVVVGLVRLEPLAIVVAGQAAQELEALVGEVAHRITPRCRPRRAGPSPRARPSALAR